MTDLENAWAQTKGTVEQRIAALRAMTVQRPRPIPAREIKRLWGQRMVLAAVYEAASDPTVAKPLRILCRATYDNLMGDLFGDLDPADPAQAPTIKGFLDGLQMAGVLSDAVRAETLALGMQDALAFPAIDYAELHAAGLISDADAGLQE